MLHGLRLIFVNDIVIFGEYDILSLNSYRNFRESVLLCVCDSIVSFQSRIIFTLIEK